MLIYSKNYYLMIEMYCGTDELDVNKDRTDINFIQLNTEDINSFSITSTLLTPWITGKFTYKDAKNNSKLRNMIGMPKILADITFMQTNESDTGESPSTLTPFEDEVFTETVMIKSINEINFGHDDVTFEFTFEMIDSINFNSLMEPVSTFTNSTDHETFDIVLKKMFGSVKLGDRLDNSTNTIKANVAFISSPNSTLLSSLEYTLKKIYDYDRSKPKDFCKIVYNSSTRKYELWKFGDVGTVNGLKCKSDNAEYRTRREIVSFQHDMEAVDFGVVKTTICQNSDSKNLERLFGDRIFKSYDYIMNHFKDVFDKNVRSEFSEHDTEIYEDKKRSSYILENCKNLQNIKYTSESSYSRQNDSIYDVFNEMIFSSPYLKVNTEGCIGRKAGDEVIFSTSSNIKTPFQLLDGDYFITGITHTLSRNGLEWDFRSEMDLYSPFVTKDNKKI